MHVVPTRARDERRASRRLHIEIHLIHPSILKCLKVNRNFERSVTVLIVEPIYCF